jgi:hypothetical protein
VRGETDGAMEEGYKDRRDEAELIEYPNITPAILVDQNPFYSSNFSLTCQKYLTIKPI